MMKLLPLSHHILILRRNPIGRYLIEGMQLVVFNKRCIFRKQKINRRNQSSELFLNKRCIFKNPKKKYKKSNRINTRNRIGCFPNKKSIFKNESNRINTRNSIGCFINKNLSFKTQKNRRDTIGPRKRPLCSQPHPHLVNAVPACEETARKRFHAFPFPLPYLVQETAIDRRTRAS
jgi:hypothetical protein